MAQGWNSWITIKMNGKKPARMIQNGSSMRLRAKSCCILFYYEGVQGVSIHAWHTRRAEYEATPLTFIHKNRRVPGTRALTNILKTPRYETFSKPPYHWIIDGTKGSRSASYAVVTFILFQGDKYFLIRALIHVSVENSSKQGRYCFSFSMQIALFIFVHLEEPYGVSRVKDP